MFFTYFSDCGSCSRILRVYTEEITLKDIVGTYECFGHLNGKSLYKMTERSLYLYFSSKYPGYKIEDGWMVKN